MCQLLAMNANTPTDVMFSFTGFATRAEEHKDGFGIAFFEGNRHHRKRKAPAAEFHAGVAFAAAFHAAFARQQQDVVVVEDFHMDEAPTLPSVAAPRGGSCSGPAKPAPRMALGVLSKILRGGPS